MAKRAAALAVRLSEAAMPRMLSAEEVALFAAVPGQDTLPGFTSAAEVLTRPARRQAKCADLFSVVDLAATQIEVRP